MAKTAYESITTSEEFDYNKFKAVVKELNDSNLIPSKVNVVGKKEMVVKKFLDAVEKILEEDVGKMPDSVYEMNNAFIDILEASDNSAGEEKADANAAEERLEQEEAKAKVKDKEKKPKKEKQASNIVLMEQLLNDKKSDEEILNTFTERYGTKGMTDTKFIEKRVATYKSLAKK